MFQNQGNMIIPTIFVLNGVQRNTQKHLRDILSWTWYAQHNTKHSTMHKNEEQTCRISIILTKLTKPIYQTHQNINKTIFNNHISISQYKHKIQEKLGLETWNTLKIIENPYLFLKIDEGLKKKMEVLWVTMEVLGEGEVDKTRCVHVMWRKTKNCLKTI